MTSQWQPIDTARKDQPVLVLHKGVAHIAEYGTYYSQLLRADMTGWWDRQDWYLPECTHWMPLLEPPAESEQA